MDGVQTGAAQKLLDRQSLVAPLRGRILEIGPGRGVNLPHYPPEAEWVGIEPAGSKHRAIRRRARQLGRSVRLHAAGAEEIPLADASVDAVAGTFVLCSVRDVRAALAEIRRVLRPGATFVFLEHVAAPAGTRTRRLQHVWTRVPFAQCRPDQHTGEILKGADFTRVDYIETTARGVFGLQVPLIRGTAVR